MRIRLACALVLLLAATRLAAAQEIRPTLEKIKETGVIALGHRETSRPFSFVGNDGQPTGYSVDLCLQVVAGLRRSLKMPELKVTWVAVTPGDRIPRLVKGQIDLECGSTTITFTRMEQVAFSHMIFVDGGSLLATAASGISTAKDLGGKKVGVIRHTTTEKALAEAMAKAGVQATVVPIADHGEGVRALDEGRIDAYATDRVLLASLRSASREPGKLRLSDEFLSYEPYGLMLRRGDNPFQASVNRTLSQLYRSGLVSIYEHWFGPFASASPLVRALYLLHSWPD
jgi:glutamate/aspartate transport system substrate-binding protein